MAKYTVIEEYGFGDMVQTETVGTYTSKGEAKEVVEQRFNDHIDVCDQYRNNIIICDGDNVFA